MGKDKRLCTVLLVILAICLSACAASKISYENIGDAMCDIHGYDAAALSYIVETESLYFASPYFLDDFFEGITTEGAAKLDGETISISFTRHDDINSGAIHGASIEFEVDVEKETVIMAQFTSFENYTIELPEESMVKIGTQLAEIIQDVQLYLEQ